MLITIRQEGEHRFTLTVVVVNTCRGHLNREKVDDLWRLSLFSEICFQQNTSQKLGGDVYGTWLQTVTYNWVIVDNIVQQAQAAGFDVEVVTAV